MIQEEFAFRSYIERVSHGFRLAYDLLQHITGISLITASIRAVHITDQTRHLALLGSPRKCSKSAVIRVQIHITLFHPHKSFHWGTVKHYFVIQSIFQMTGSDRKVLHISKQVGKLESDKLHIFVFHHFQNIFFRVFTHLGCSFSRIYCATIPSVSINCQSSIFTEKGRTSLRKRPCF